MGLLVMIMMQKSALMEIRKMLSNVSVCFMLVSIMSGYGFKCILMQMCYYFQDKVLDICVGDEHTKQ